MNLSDKLSMSSNVAKQCCQKFLKGYLKIWFHNTLV